jgi:O-antigen/teichoic acid export membrane protein
MGHPLIRQNAIYFSGSLLALILAFLFQFVAGRLLGPERYSAVAAIFSLYFVLLVPGLMVTTIGMRHVAMLKASGRLGELSEFFRLATVRLWALSLTGGLIVAALHAPLSSFLHVPAQALLALVPAVVLLLPASLNRGVLQGEQRFFAASWVPSLEALTRTVLVATVLAALLGEIGAILALSAGVLVGYVASLWALRHLAQKSAGEPSRGLIRVPTFAGPTMAGVLGVTMLYTADVLLVKHFLPSRESGLYGSVVTLGRIVFMTTTSITTVMFAQVAANAASRTSSARVLAVSALLISAIGVAFTVVFWVVPAVVLLPFGSQYSQAAPYLPYFAAAMAMLSLVNLLVNYLVANHDPRFLPIILLADVAEVALIAAFHQNLWTVVGIVFGVASASLISLLALVFLNRGRQPI